MLYWIYEYWLEAFKAGDQWADSMSFLRLLGYVTVRAGLACVFVLGEVAQIVPVLPSPFYVYVEPLQFVSLPGIYTGQQSTSWSVPNLPQLRGYELVVQQVVLPLASTQAPPLQLPPGWRFVLRLKWGVSGLEA